MSDSTTTTRLSRAESIRIPVAFGEWVNLRMMLPTTQKKWDQLMRLLDVMEPALVKDDE